MSDVNTHHFPHGDILVVDDNKSDLKFLSSILREAGYKVRPASDGELALRSVRARLPALILLDVTMPDPDGYEVCRRLKDAEDTRDIPVIFISVRTSPLDKVKAFGVGSVDYISKPFEPEEVLARVATHLALWKAQKAIEEKNLQLQQDIIEHKRTEEALRESEARLQGLFETMAEGMIFIAPDGQIVQANPAAERILGLQRSEIEARNYVAPEWEILRPNGTPMLPEEMAGPRAMKERHLVEDVVMGAKRPDGSISWISVSAAPLMSESGELEGVVSTFADVTERKRAEQKLQEYSERLEEMVEERTQELREAQEELIRKEKLALLGTLAGGVAHEVRNPLSVISNAIYYLQMVLSDADETTREYLDIISSGVHDADKLVSDLLGFSRTRFPDREKTAISGLVAQVLKKRPPPEEVEVITEIPADLSPVYVDPRQIGQMLDNLVANAYQAMPEGGKLTISAETSPLSRARGRAGVGVVAISITDTGCGIPEENLEKIFEPLFTTKARGIGLGLAVSRNLVEANGGSIDVKSEVGKSSTFTVRLPLGRAL